MKEKVAAYIADKDPDAQLNLGGDYQRIKKAYEVFKEIVVEGRRNPAPSSESLESAKSLPPRKVSSAPSRGADEPEASENLAKSKEVIKKLQLALQQREYELDSMVRMLERKRTLEKFTQTEGAPLLSPSSSFDSLKSASLSAANGPGNANSTMISSSFAEQQQQQQQNKGNHSEQLMQKHKDEIKKLIDPGIDLNKLLEDESLRDRAKAFEMFRSSYIHSAEIEKNKAVLEAKIGWVKEFAQKINESKSTISLYCAIFISEIRLGTQSKIKSRSI